MEERVEHSVLVSVLNYNNVVDTLSTLDCLKKQKYRDFDLELVDNGSVVGCIEEIIQQMPDIVIIKNKKNSGFAGGVNSILTRGFEQGYRYIIVCNNDIELDEFAVEYMIETATRFPDAALVGGLERSYFTNRILAAGGQGYNLWTSRPKWINKAALKPHSIPSPVDYIQGSMMLFTHKAYEVGLLIDGSLFMYFEEVDLGFQLKKKGVKAYIDDRVSIRHKAEKKRLNLRGGYYQQRNRIYLIKKYGKWYHISFNILYITFLELPIKTSIRTLQGRPDYALACIVGYRDGIRSRMGERPIPAQPTDVFSKGEPTS
jgi:GT2 family glycosyltransferase